MDISIRCNLRTAVWAASCIGLATADCGCSEGPRRTAVTGTVIFEGGKPVDRGMIEFSPLDKNSGTNGGAVIVNGVYLIPRSQGLLSGKYLVRVYSPESTPSASGGPGALGVPPPRECVSPRFNIETRIQVEIRDEEEKVKQLDFTVEPATDTERKNA